MDKIIKVTLWGKEVAAVIWNQEKRFAVIEFFNSFALNNWDISPLKMPLSDLTRGERIFSFPHLRDKTFKGLPGLLADALPDDYGNSVIDEWFASQHLSIDVTPLDRLLYIGKRGMGALEFEPDYSNESLNDSTTLSIKGLEILANEVLNQRSQFEATIQKNANAYNDILKVGTSAGGAKPKAIIALNELTGELRSGQVKAPDGFSYWILKFDGMEGGKIKDNPLGIGRIEYAYYKMALDAGIHMSESRLWLERDKAHFMTKRFDRTENGAKLHTQTLCGIAHFDRDERYSYEQLFQVMRQLHLPYQDIEQMYRRMVFNVIFRNQDDHTKNHSFIMQQNGQWTLAPAYDICYAYDPSGTWTRQHQLSLVGKRDDFTKDDLISFGKNADIKNPKLILEQILHIAHSWDQYAYETEVLKHHQEQIKRHLRLDL